MIASPLVTKYLDSIYLSIGCFIILIGLTTVFYKGKSFSYVCSWINKGNIRNVGVLGFLIGLAPCLPLLGILNYIILVSQTNFQAIIFTLIFGLGTIISPLFLMVLFSGKLVSQFAKSNTFKIAIRLVCGLILIFLGGRIILQILLQ